jgi:hypothetical protein
MTEIKIKSIYGNLLFTYKAENATIRDAVEKAVKEKVSLRLADLSSANLRSADLSLADLRLADLSSANLSLADLRLADLSSAKNKETAYLPLFCKWNFSILGCEIQIGCEKRTIEQWDLFFASNEKLTTERGTEDFKQIEAVYNACKAYLLTLN